MSNNDSRRQRRVSAMFHQSSVLVMISLLFFVQFSLLGLPMVSSFSPTSTTTSTTSTSGSKLAVRAFTRNLSLRASTSLAVSTLEIGKEIGNGSYGTVHLCSVEGSKEQFICKRPWTKEDLAERESKTTAERCKYYFDVEQHCFQKMNRVSSFVTNYVDTLSDASGNKWMTFKLLTGKDGKSASPTLEDVLELDWEDQHEAGSVGQHHHLFKVQEALGMDAGATFGDTLDTVLMSLLKGISFVHSQGIVHRDMKPANLLCDASTNSLVLIDFGSAADMDPVQANLFTKKRIGLEDRVAVSPVYAAPEIFIKPDHSPFAFDVYSSSLIFCQLLFNLLDKRTDAAFHQQIEDASWDLDSWLSRELSSKVRPAWLSDALEYLGERPGLWALLSKMFRRDPDERISSKGAVNRFEEILKNYKNEVVPEKGLDGAFFEDVLRAMDNCEVPFFAENTDFVPPRPLHYVASFRRSVSLGLVLAEADEEVDLEGGNLEKWKEATIKGNPGDVFVAGVVEGGQAEEIGIFEIGDKLLSVGDLPVANGGFEKVVGMLQRLPKSSKYVKLQFNRVSVRKPSLDEESQDTASPAVHIIDEGAWSSTGKRKANEDAFVLHEINLDKDVLMAGVFDGHGGKAASQSASQLMPSLFTEELTFVGEAEQPLITSRQALELAWQRTVQSYQGGCDEFGECVAEYNEQDGIILAGTGSEDLIAGTTASVLSLVKNELTILNCGDSRTLLIDAAGNIAFETADHSPDVEVDRIQRGIDQGLGYALPECSLSKWWMTVGDYQYSVARSLEGPFATSKGIVSDADVTSLRPCPGILLMASDGLWEVCGNEEIAKEVTKLRQQGLEANAAAKRLCTRAIEKGSTDNVSVVLVYLE
jgi:serine/threonine protein phosphatase PrpC/serine/threonine protein kinase